MYVCVCVYVCMCVYVCVCVCLQVPEIDFPRWGRGWQVIQLDEVEEVSSSTVVFRGVAAG